jgi:hypothetical protein
LDQIDLLRRLVGVLDGLGSPYMVVGSLASAAYGEPRMTQDIDVVVDMQEEQVAPLCRAFSPDEFYVSAEAAKEAVRRKGQFSIIDAASGNKIDLMILPAGDWGQAEISRRQRMRILPDLEGYCARPEDVILGKMLYYREGGSDKHLRDVVGIMKVSGDEVDRQYVLLWAERMGLSDIWQAILRRLVQKA